MLTQHCMQKLAENKDLERRLDLVEEQLQHTKSSLYDSTSVHSKRVNESGSSGHVSCKNLFDADPLHHEFEETLHASWVYRRSQNRRSSLSIRSSVLRQSAWSALSELSMAQISINSVICLPVERSELFNADWYAQGERRNGKLPVRSKENEQAPEVDYHRPNLSLQGEILSWSEKEYRRPSSTYHEGSVNAFDDHEVDPDLFEQTLADPNVDDITLPLQGVGDGRQSKPHEAEEANSEKKDELHSLQDAQHKSSSPPPLTPAREKNNDLLIKAFQEALFAYVLICGWNGQSVLTIYKEMCVYLDRCIRETTSSVDREKIAAIRQTYLRRIDALTDQEEVSNYGTILNEV